MIPKHAWARNECGRPESDHTHGVRHEGMVRVESREIWACGVKIIWCAWKARGDIKNGSADDGYMWDK